MHPAGRGRRVYAFTGLLRCARCGGVMVGKGGKWRANGYLCFASAQKANLRTNRNREQLTLINDPLVCDFHDRWFDDELARHEGEGDGEG